MEMEMAITQSKAQAKMGFANIAFLISLPLLTCLMAGLSLMLIGILNRTAADSHCRLTAMRLQQSLGSLMKELMSLNSQAKRLRAQRELAERQLKAAYASRVPQAIAAAEAYRAAVVSAQVALASRQKMILAQAHVARTSTTLSRIGHGVLWTNQSVGPMRGLAVEPKPANSLTPDYVPMNDFEDAQQAKFNYKQNLFFNVPEAVKSFLPSGQGTYACSATLKSSESKWIAVLFPAKP